jgi:hypothetical protein
VTIWDIEEKIPPEIPYAVRLQIARVSLFLLSRAPKRKIEDFEDIVALFRFKRLLAARLVEFCERIHPLHLGYNLAVPFAACVFPKRVFQMGKTEFTAKFANFLQIYYNLQSATQEEIPENEVVEELRNGDRIPPDLDRDFLVDLSGADVPSLDSKERRLRVMGAALFLSTCSQQDIQHAIEIWRDLFGFLKVFRTWLPEPPSVLTGMFDRDSIPSQDELRSALEISPKNPFDELHASEAVILEMMTWKEARKRIHNYRGHRREAVRAFWEGIWERLISGFPFFAFSSRLGYWWKKCLLNHPFSKWDDPNPYDGNVDPDTLGTTPSPPIASDLFLLTLDFLKVLREAYRYIRSTFHAITGGPVATERIREALDRIWFCIIEKLLSDEDPEELIREIEEEFPDLSIPILSHRLRARVWAFVLARYLGLPSDDLRDLNVPRNFAKPDGAQTSLRTETSLDPIFALAKTVHPSETFFWAFLVHLLFKNLIVPQRQDVWSAERFFHEVWIWATDPAVNESLQASRFGGRMGAVLSTDTIMDEFLTELVDVKYGDDLRRYLSRSDLDSMKERFIELFWSALNPGYSFADACERIVSCRKTFKTQTHWIVPVFYLKYVEGLVIDSIVNRLVRDPDEENVVREIATRL